MTSPPQRDGLQHAPVYPPVDPETVQPSALNVVDDLPPAISTDAAAAAAAAAASSLRASGRYDNLYFYGLCVGVPFLALLLYIGTCVHIFWHLDGTPISHGSMDGIRLHSLSPASSSVADGDDDDLSDTPPPLSFRVLHCLWTYGACRCCYCCRRHFPSLVRPVDRLDHPKLI